jgi:nitroimidazol reductase NimA-like FMN-containing flavoprotein (pyridoxamine 5'-phosphate oxidase superfamily)
MKLVDSHSGVEVIERSECLMLLQSRFVGRLALVEGGQPQIYPVNYAMDGDHVIFRTGDGTKFATSMRGGAVSFEVDEVDQHTRTGWSVVVSGWARVINDLVRIERLAEVELEPWSGPLSHHWVAVNPERITGRRVAPGTRRVAS